MITNILKLADIFSKLVKIKSIFEFIKKNISQKVFFIFLCVYSVTITYIVVDTTLNVKSLLHRVDTLEEINKHNSHREVANFANKKIKFLANQKALKTKNIYYTYRDVDILNTKKQVKNISILQGIFCHNPSVENPDCISNESLRGELEKLKIIDVSNDTKKWFKLIKKYDFKLIDGYDVNVYCGSFELKNDNIIYTILSHIKPTKTFFGFGCRFENTNGVGFLSDVNAVHSYSNIEDFLEDNFKEFFKVWQDEYEVRKLIEKQKKLN